MELCVKIVSDVTEDAPYILVDHHKLRSISKMYDRRVEFNGKIESSILVDLTIEELNILEEIIMKDECIYSSDKITNLINVCDYMNISNDVFDKILSIDPNKIVLDWYDCLLEPNKFDATTMQFIKSYIDKQSHINIDIFQTPLHVLNSKSEIIHKFIAKQLFYTFISAEITNFIDDTCMSILNMLNMHAIESSRATNNKIAALDHFIDTMIDIIKVIIEQNRSIITNSKFDPDIMMHFFSKKENILNTCNIYYQVLNREFSIDVFTDMEKLLELLKYLSMTLKTMHKKNDLINIYFPGIELYDKLVRMLKSVENLNTNKNIIKYCPWIPSVIISQIIPENQYNEIMNEMITQYPAIYLDPLDEIDDLSDSESTPEPPVITNTVIRGEYELKPGKDTVLPNGLVVHVKYYQNLYIIEADTSRPLLLCIKYSQLLVSGGMVLSTAPGDAGIIVHNNHYSSKSTNKFGGQILSYNYMPLTLYGSKIIMPILFHLLGDAGLCANNLWICYAEYL